MNEVERKVRAEFEKILRRDHGMNPKQDGQWINGLWANLDPEAVQDVCRQPSTVIDLVADAVESDLYSGYLAFKRGTPPKRSLDAKGPDELLGGTDGDLRDWSGGAAPDGRTKDSVRERIAALSAYLSKIVAADVSVIALRKDLLGGPAGTLSPESATELLHALAGEQRVGSSEEAETLHWIGGEAGAEVITVWPGSKLRRLKTVSARLANRYPWTEEQACYLILTGKPVRVAIMKAKTSTSSAGVPAHRCRRSTVTIEVDSWVPSEYVRLAYHDLQREILGENNRQPERRNVALFRFVVDQSTLQLVDDEENLAKLTTPKWKELRELWNERYPENHEWHYGRARAHRFGRDFERGQRAVVGTEYGFPGVPGMPKRQDEVTRDVVEMLRKSTGRR